MIEKNDKSERTADGDGETSTSSRQQRDLIAAAWMQVQEVRTTEVPASPTRARGQQEAMRLWNLTTDLPEIPGFRLDEEVFRGGQGVVYRGVQESTGRTVAIKVMLGGSFAGPRERMRFEREVQVLARLQHPNIVTIHDSGIASGCAYFVMDFIAGDPLDKFVEKTQPTLRDRLRMFVRICDAVHAAHVHGIIHRDIKPGNIRIDERGEPQVLDFGLAKTEDDEADEARPTMTQTGQFVGSLPWSSPEQALGQIDAVDTRSDVYSLGVVLFQVLTGQFPYSVSGSLSETARRISSVEPEDPRRYNGALDGEVSTIVLKALRKDRGQRYQTAGALGADVKRYLRGEPIEAKRDSVSYVIRKHLERHKVAAGVLLGFAFTILAGFFVSISFWRQAVIARDAERQQTLLAKESADTAQRRAIEARTEAARAEAVTEFLTDLLSSVRPAEGGRTDVTVQEAMDAAARRLDAGAFDHEPELQRRLHAVLADAYYGFGLEEPALHHLDVAMEDWAGSDRPDAPAALEVRAGYADILRHQGKLDEAEAIFEELLDKIPSDDATGKLMELRIRIMNAQAGVERGRDRQPEAVEILRDALAAAEKSDVDIRVVAETQNDLGLALDAMGDYAGARAALEEAVRLSKQRLGEGHFHTAIGMSNLAGVYSKLGQRDDAENLFGQALEVFRAAGGDRHPTVASCLDAIGRFLIRSERYAEAKPNLLEALSIRKEVLGEDHLLVAYSYNNLALGAYRMGELDEAADYFTRAFEIFRERRGANHPSTHRILGNLAAVQRDRGDTDTAVPYAREALAIAVRSYGADDVRTAASQHNLGKVLCETGSCDEGLEILQAALRTRTAKLGEANPDTINTMEAIASALSRGGERDRAAALARKALELRTSVSGDDHAGLAESNSTLGLILDEMGEGEESLAALRRALELAADTLPKGHWRTAAFRTNLGGALVKAERYDEAERELLEAYTTLHRQFSDSHPRTRRTIELIAKLCDEQGRTEDAAGWRDRIRLSEARGNQPPADPTIEH